MYLPVIVAPTTFNCSLIISTYNLLILTVTATAHTHSTNLTYFELWSTTNRIPIHTTILTHNITINLTPGSELLIFRSLLLILQVSYLGFSLLTTLPISITENQYSKSLLLHCAKLLLDGKEHAFFLGNLFLVEPTVV